MEILVVDDSSVMRKMITKTIQLCGLDVGRIFEAGDGKEGLQVLEKENIDLLFIDINMPVMDGMEMLGKVRQKTRTLPILILSTESNRGRIQLIDEHGAKFVHKPFTPELLRENILSVTEKM